MAPTTRSSKRALVIPEDSNPKRRRLAAKVLTQPPPPLSSFVKHPKLWFADGSIVLAAEHLCFKVHRSQLASFCTVFKDMFSQPSGGPDQEIMEDCVVVRMPDNGTDLANFLQAMYNGCSFDFEVYSAANFPAVSGVLRLATKYDSDMLRNLIVCKFRAQYSLPLHFPASNEPYRVCIINLARECDLLDLLPACFYQLAFPNGSFPGPEPIELLAPADRKRLKQGRKAVLRRVAARLSEAPNASPDCQYPEPRKTRGKRKKRPCAIFLDTLLAETFQLGPKMQGPVAKNPLQQLTYLPDLPLMPPKGQPCYLCKSRFRRHMAEVGAAVQANLRVDFML